MVIFDLETTGTDTQKDRIVQICVKDGDKITTRLINPEIPIPKESSDIHGITDEMVKDAPTFSKIAKSLYELLKGKDLVTFNGNHFDIPLLINEFARCGIDFDVSGVKLIDVSNIYRRLNPRDLNSAYKQYTGLEIDGAHNAENDVLATEVLLRVMKERHADELPEDLDLYSNYDKKRLDLKGFFLYNSDENIIFANGKHEGELASSQPSYLRWMIEKGDFEKCTINIAKQILEKWS